MEAPDTEHATEETARNSAGSEEAISEQSFLLNFAPGRIAKLLLERHPTYQDTCVFEWPAELTLNCSGDRCAGPRVFEALSPAGVSLRAPLGGGATLLRTYRCRNCRASRKFYVITGKVADQAGSTAVAYVAKVGELPRFGGPLPPHLIELAGAGEALEYLEKGLDAESQGLGIGAFAYYRRFVDHQKDALFDKIIEVAELRDLDSGMIEDLRAAKKQPRFSEAMRAVNPAVPASLLIRGQNPLILLYGAVSASLHGQKDEDCLRLASDVRLLLADLADRMHHLLASAESVKAVVDRLTAHRTQANAGK